MHHQIIHIQPRHPRRDTLLQNLLRKLIRPVHHQLHLPPRSLIDPLQPLIIQMDVLNTVIRPVNVAERRRQEIDPRVDELRGFLGRGEKTLQIPSVLDPRLTTLDPAWLRLGRDPVLVAVLDQVVRARQVLLLLVVSSYRP